MNKFKEIFTEKVVKIKWDKDVYSDAGAGFAYEFDDTIEIGFGPESDAYFSIYVNNDKDITKLVKLIKNNGSVLTKHHKGEGDRMDDYQFEVKDKSKFDKLMKKFANKA